MSSPSSQATKIHVYQIDFTAVASGKLIASTKRRVRWRFGFANPVAIAAGETGTACRGEEHDVTFVWSLTSGKRIVIADGQEVHYSCNRSTTFEFSWTMRGNHVLKISASANPPMTPTPGFRQYDFFVNGQSFFYFPKLFRLGLSPGDLRGPQGGVPLAEAGRRYRRTQSDGTGIASLEAPHNVDEEELYLQEAIRQSLTDNKTTPQKTTKADPAEVDLLDFGGSAVPALPLSTTNSSGATSALTTSTPYRAPAASDPWSGGTSYPVGDYPALAAPPAPVTGNAAGGDTSVRADATNPYAENAFGTGTGASNPFAVQPDPGLGALVPAGPSNPYSQMPNSYTSSTSAQPNPYGPPVTANTNPYAPPSAAANTNPYAAPPAALSANPYAAPPTSNPYAAPPAAPNSNPYAAPPAAPNSNPYAMSSAAPTSSTNPYAPPSASTAVSYSSSFPSQTSASNPFGVASANGNPYSVPSSATSGFGAPPPVATNLYAETSVPPVFTPKPQQTPSTLGFGSPPGDFNFASPLPSSNQGPEQGVQQHDNVLSMNSLADHNVHMEGTKTVGGLDQAFSKLVNLDTFSLSSKKDEIRSNPFESKANDIVGGSRSLADLHKNKAPPKKDIMKTPGMGAMVVSSNQNGSYASQYGIQPQMQQQPQQLPYSSTGMTINPSGLQGAYSQQYQMPGAPNQPTMQPSFQSQPMPFSQQPPAASTQSQQQFFMQQSFGQPPQNFQQQQAPFTTQPPQNFQQQQAPFTTQIQNGQGMMSQPPVQQGYY